MDAIDLDTPALYVDVPTMLRNIREMQRQCGAWKVGLRPHTKTHKIAEIAQQQLDEGAIGITVAKLGEAEVLPGDDVLVAYPLMPEKLSRLLELAKKRTVPVAIDSVEAAKILSGGSTPGATKTPLIPRTTEIRPGTYVFYDASSLEAKCCLESDCALRVITTVVSTAVPGQCLIDAGSKTLSSDATRGPGTYGQFPGRPWTLRKMNEE